jgi:hypothetical protein
MAWGGVPKGRHCRSASGDSRLCLQGSDSLVWAMPTRGDIFFHDLNFLRFCRIYGYCDGNNASHGLLLTPKLSPKKLVYSSCRMHLGRNGIRLGLLKLKPFLALLIFNSNSGSFPFPQFGLFLLLDCKLVAIQDNGSQT